MPYLDKNVLKLDYKDVGKELNKLFEALECQTDMQNSEVNNILTKVKCQQIRFECIKYKHEKLIHRFQKHRKSILFYICHFLSLCC